MQNKDNTYKISKFFDGSKSLEKKGIFGVRGSHSGDFLRKALGIVETPEFLKNFHTSGLQYKIRKELCDNAKVDYNFYQMELPKGTKIESLEIRGKSFNEKDGLYIINFLGNRDTIEENIRRDAKISSEKNVVNISFNYPGTLGSTGKLTSKETMLEAGVGQVQRLLENGVSPDKIILRGYSMGGAIATMTASLFHEHGIKVNLFNDRSFSKIVDIPGSKIHASLDRHGCFLLPDVSFKLSHVLLKPIAKFSSWNIDVSKTYNDIPEENKDYMVVMSSKKDRKRNLDDGIIGLKSSVYYSDKQERKRKKKSVDVLCDTIEKLSLEKSNNPKKLLFKMADISYNQLEKDLKGHKPEQIEILKKVRKDMDSLKEEYQKKGNKASDFQEHILEQDIKSNLKKLRNLIKYDHKFILDEKNMLNETDSQTLKNLYETECIVIGKDPKGSFHNNIKSIPKELSSYGKWLEMRLKPNLEVKPVLEMTKEEEKKFKQNFNAHILPLKYLTTRDEMNGKKINAEKYFENFMERIRERSNQAVEKTI